MRQFSSDPGEPVTLDHVGEQNTEPTDAEKAEATAAATRHAAKLAEAARRHGKPFQCAIDGLPRKVIKEGVDKVVGVAPAPVPQPEPPNVTAISVRTKR